MGKRDKKRDEGEEIARELLRLMPTLPRVLPRVFRRVENFDYRQPTTIIQKIKKDFDGLIAAAISNDKVGAMLFRLFSKAGFGDDLRRMYEDLIKNLKREAASDSRYSEILRLMGEADARIPFVSMFVSQRHADFEQRLSAQCAPVDLLQQAETLRGEARANVTILALSVTVERVYRFYLITIWQLSFFRKGEMPPHEAPVTGNLLKEVQLRLPDYPNLVEPDAVWMRNSAVHNPCEYVPQTDSVVMWDKKIPRAEVKVDDLLAMVQRMYSVSAVTMQRVAQLYLLRNLLLNTGLLSDIIDSLPDTFSGDSTRQQAVEDRLTKRGGEILEPMRDFFEAHQKVS